MPKELTQLERSNKIAKLQADLNKELQAALLWNRDAIKNERERKAFAAGFAAAWTLALNRAIK